VGLWSFVVLVVVVVVVAVAAVAVVVAVVVVVEQNNKNKEGNIVLEVKTDGLSSYKRTNTSKTKKTHLNKETW